MKPNWALLLTALLLCSTTVATAATLYVDLNSTNPSSPYSDWSTAATNIQDAVDTAESGDTIFVTNGIYQTGGRPLAGSSLTNRVLIAKPLILQSVNGPAATKILGNQQLLSTNALRCVYATNGVTVSGFTISGGATRATGSSFAELGGGGVFCESSAATITNCILTGNMCMSQLAQAGGGAVYQGTLIDCVISNNMVTTNATSYQVGGGGAFKSTLFNCMIVSNRAQFGGGGAYACTLSNCSVVRNTASAVSTASGGGLSACTATRCWIADNFSSALGGGDAASLLTLCVLSNNTARGVVSASGGGGYGSVLNNCLVISNFAYGKGGGAYAASLTNCTVVGNTATNGTGVYGGTVRNSILVGNRAASGNSLADCYLDSSTARGSIAFCCTPRPISTYGWGTGNLTQAVAFVDAGQGNFRLPSDSPCINAGDNAQASTNDDLDGTPRIAGGTVDIGAYEVQNPTSRISYAWLQQYGLPTDGSADQLDSDSDGMNNWQEWRCATIPTNSLSILRLLLATNTPAGIAVTWSSVSGVRYLLQRCTNLGSQAAFVTFTNLTGQPGATTALDPDPATDPAEPRFYRVAVP